MHRKLFNTFRALGLVLGLATATMRAAVAASSPPPTNVC